ncbi:PadR family transcriptional regulator [Microbacterium sp. SORGH_AS_0888]|uniref:PadR family transcriptional regulator n=1 Tax=Microbacterium sp. SORGH_AS_0888 TaxID=3041791 RepID=UPI002782072C|nr:PadR family transcriptional regulator [Microbacterium sp. SORGH_AS_0888]MDQ1129848.1 DNA-binding PadR family transcriptional regulator [Microbacterium sp. SORGH_AS_0888]
MTGARSRLTPLGVMLLALLREDDMHPYEMLRLLRHRHDERIVPITGGTVYHTVARLERRGLIEEVGVEREGNRPERTTYRLREEGAEALLSWVREELPRIDRPAEFRVALAESHNLDRQEVLDLLRAHRAALVADDEITTDGLVAARERGVPEQYLVEVERQATLVAAELGWLAAFMSRLEDPGFAWGPDDEDTASDRYLTQRKAARQ